MISIRTSTFETNSSSCNCVTTIPKDVMLEWESDSYDRIMHIDSPGEYQTTDKYTFMTLEEAVNYWNSKVDEFNNLHKSSKYITPARLYSVEDSYEFREAIENDELIKDDIFGRFLTFKMFLTNLVIEHDVKANITWWNYD